MRSLLVLLLISVLSACGAREPDRPLQVATASNAAEAVREIATLYEAKRGRPVDVVIGASGTHASQILNGAPYDIFLSADSLLPARLDSLGLGVPGSRFTYALGSLVLWSPERGNLTAEALRSAPGKRLAIANPRLAPYGRAAMEALGAMGLREEWENRIVIGESVGQAFQFAGTRSVDFGLVAESQARAGTGFFWRVPDTLYSPIVQQALQLTDHPDAEPFLVLLRSPEGRDILHEAGYRTVFRYERPGG